MLNHRPIFIHGFQRGGTTILQNLLDAHPAVGLAEAEIHEIFYGRHSEPVHKWFARLRYLPIRVGTLQPVFSHKHTTLRPPVAQFWWPYIDRLFYRSMSEAYDKLPAEARADKRPLDELRLMAKGVNATAFTTDLLYAMYPDSTHIALVRDGLALSDGFIRRGWPAEKIAGLYNAICQKMLSDAATYPRYSIVKFEELVGNPQAVTQKVFEQCELDLSAVKHFRLQSKASMDKDGVRRMTLDAEKLAAVPVEFNRLDEVLRKDVNANQIKNLSAQDKDTVLQIARGALQQLGYL
jgi:hypothetical protein